MIHVIEGVNAAGKSTFAKYLSRILDVPIYQDLGRKDYQREGRGGAELQDLTPGFERVVEQVGVNHDFVLDRYWPTTFVFKRLNPDRPSLPLNLRGGPIERARRSSASESLYYVRTDLKTVTRRLSAREEAFDVEAVVAELDAYDRLFVELMSAGIRVVVVDGSIGLGGVV